MIITESHLKTINDFLCDINDDCVDDIENRARAEDVIEVLRHGNEKHPDDCADFIEHAQHGVNHMAIHRSSKGYADKSYLNESESGLPHKAHAIARCLLAIMKAGDE